MISEKIIFILFFILIVIGQPAFSQSSTEKDTQRCDTSTINLIGKHFGIPDFSYPAEEMYRGTKNLIVADACKPWPQNKSQTIAIFAYNNNIEYERALIIALVNTKKRQVIASYKGAISEDAAMTIGKDSMLIDTSRYQLAPNVRAFGLELTTSYT